MTAIRCAAQNPNQPRSLTPAQRRTTEMLVDRIIPADELGPGSARMRSGELYRHPDGGLSRAAEGRVGRRVGRAGCFRDAKRRARRSRIFRQRRETRCSTIAACKNLQAFFNTARTYTMQGTFGDPHYGGNIDGKGWDIIRYPGPRLRDFGGHAEDG